MHDITVGCCCLGACSQEVLSSVSYGNREAYNDLSCVEALGSWGWWRPGSKACSGGSPELLDITGY
jgi:hypothetical protein